jgi:hypothetical protein
MSRSIETQRDSDFRATRPQRVANAFAYYYFYFSRVGRLPHAGWEGNP